MYRDFHNGRLAQSCRELQETSGSCSYRDDVANAAHALPENVVRNVERLPTKMKTKTRTRVTKPQNDENETKQTGELAVGRTQNMVRREQNTMRREPCPMKQKQEAVKRSQKQQNES